MRADVRVDDAVVDTVSTTVGFRSTTWTAGEGGDAPFSLNGEAIKFRGFSHHNSIGGLGVAIPERVELFRVQARSFVGARLYESIHSHASLEIALSCFRLLCHQLAYVDRPTDPRCSYSVFTHPHH